MPYKPGRRIDTSTSTGWYSKHNSVTFGEPRFPTPYLITKGSHPNYYWQSVRAQGLAGYSGPSDVQPGGSIAYQLYPGRAAYAQAYDRYQKSAGERASLLISLVQYEQAASMIAKRAGDLISIVRNIKKDPLLFLRKVGVRPSKRGKEPTPYEAWLEYTFGWVPLISDIGAAVNVMQGAGLPPERIRGSAHVSSGIDYDSVQEPYRDIIQGMGHGSVSLSSRVVSVNPNLRLANSLGFTNPAHVAWDLVPFSFVVDWFLPVGKFLQSFDSFVGIELDQHCQSFHVSVDCYSRGAWQPGIGVAGMISVRFSHRNIQPPTRPGLLDRIKVPTPSLWLAATSISLARSSIASLR